MRHRLQELNFAKERGCNELTSPDVDETSDNHLDELEAGDDHRDAARDSNPRPRKRYDQ